MHKLVLNYKKMLYLPICFFSHFIVLELIKNKKFIIRGISFDTLFNMAKH